MEAEAEEGWRKGGEELSRQFLIPPLLLPVGQEFDKLWKLYRLRHMSNFQGEHLNLWLVTVAKFSSLGHYAW